MKNRVVILLRGMLVLIFMSSVSMALESREISSVLDHSASRLVKLSIGGGVVFDVTQMVQLYRERDFQPIWSGSELARSRLTQVRNLLQSAGDHGLEVDLYWAPQFEKFYQSERGLSSLDFELGVSEALLRYAKTLWMGQVEPGLVDDDIKIARKNFAENEISLIRQALEKAPSELISTMVNFESQIPLYQYLKSQMISKKAQFTQDQKNKIIATMEKLRWLPRQLGSRYAFVNLAMTELKVVENNVDVLTMKTINGRPVRRTPMMIDSMKRVEINPTWTVPLNLAIWDKLPKIQQDVSFLKRHHIKVFAPGSNAPISDVESIPWSSLNRDYFPYFLQQEAGPSNVLGKVKFPLTNGYSIYLHDTDERNLFSEASPRLRSSGCVRLQKPMEMAAYLLKNQNVPLGKGWSQSDGSEYPIGTTFTEEILMSRVFKAEGSNSSISTIAISVDNPLPLYTAFLTADADGAGGVRFIRDNYKQDARLLAILNSKGTGTPTGKMASYPVNEQKVPVILRGELGPSQLFGDVVAVRCAVWPYKGCVDKDSNGNEFREEYHFKINQEVELPEGYYIMGAENSMWPGWLEVKCQPDLFDGCIKIDIGLEKVEIPEALSQADEVFIFRDLTSIVEQNKILSQSFHNGQALIKQTPVSPKNFYLPGLNQFDVVQRLNTDFCDNIVNGSVTDVAPEVNKYCVGLSNVVGMAEYLELPIEVESERAEGFVDPNKSSGKSSRAMKVFQFPKDDNQGQAANQWTQRWVGAPGNWIDFNHRRYLVGAPLFPKNIPTEKRFVTVMPGQYRILGVNSEGNPVGQAVYRTQNIDENYERIARKVMLGEKN